MKKIVNVIVSFLIVALLVFLIGKNWIIKTALETGIGALTGFKTEIAGLKIDFPSTLEIRGLKIYNPKEFSKNVFAHIPEIYLSLALGELIKGQRLHLTEVRLDVEEINIEKTKQGVSNVELLSAVGQKGQAQKQAPAKPKEEGKKPMPFYLEKLQLTIRNVRFEDYSGMVPKKMGVDLNVKQEVFKDIRDPQALVNLILVKIIYGTTFGNLGLNPAALTGGLKDTIASGQVLLNQTASVVTERAQALATESTSKIVGEGTGVLTGVLGGTKGTVTDLAGSTKSKMSGLFGKVKSSLETSETSTGTSGDSTK